MLPTNPTTEEPTTDDRGTPSDALSAAEIGGIVGGSVGFVVMLIIVSLVIFFRCQPKKGKLHLVGLFLPFAVDGIENFLWDMFRLNRHVNYLIAKHRHLYVKLFNGPRREVWLFWGNEDILIIEN